MTMKKTAGVLLAIALLPSMAYANVVWPALIAESRITSVPIIALSVLLEAVVFRYWFKLGFRRALLYAVVANAVSGILGLFLRPLSGIAYDLSLGAVVNWLFDWGAFNPVVWVSVPVLGGALNALIELLVLRLFWKVEFTGRRYLGFWVLNALTVGLATLWVVLYPELPY
jgi:hypothetical protein